MLVCKMSPGSYLSDLAVGPAPSLDVMARFAVANTNIRHQMFMISPVRYVAEEDEAAFSETEQRTQVFAEAIYKACLRVRDCDLDVRIVHYRDSFLEAGILHIVMDYAEGGDLNNLSLIHI